MKVLLTALVALTLASCEGDPMTPTPASDEMFEYDSKPVGDPGAETYRDEARTGANVEVPVGRRSANEK
jgi:hypothetical protein